MSFAPIAPPPESSLAVRNLQGGLHGYEVLMEQYQAFWEAISHGTANRNSILPDLAKVILGDFRMGWDLWVKDQASSREMGRKLLLGITALSLLLNQTMEERGQRSLFKRLSEREECAQVDLCRSSKQLDLTEDMRVHTRLGLCYGVGEHWRLTPQLLVRCVSPAQFSSGLRDSQPGEGFVATLGATETLYPFLPSRV